MVTNLIYYLYDIRVDVIRKSKDKYIFYYDNKYYIFKEIYDEGKIYRNLSYIDGGYFFEIIPNKSNNFVSNYNNRLYILLCVNKIENRNINVNDLLNKNIIYNIPFDKFLWISLWKNKIDQVEYIINSNRNKFNIYTLSIINYYIELSEIALYYLNSNVDNNQIIGISFCHERINNLFDLYDLYDVSELIFDNYTRDIAEYIKYDIISGSFDVRKYLFINDMSNVDRVLLFSRVLFPSYFYDIFDDFVLNDKDFICFDKNFININKYEKCISDLFGIISK